MGNKKKRYDPEDYEMVKEGVRKKFGEKKEKKIRLFRLRRKFLKAFNL